MPVSSLLHIFRTIKEHGQISRTDLQQATGLSWGTITNTTRQLLARNFIREQGARATKAGRKPMQLALNTANHSLIGLEIAPDIIHAVVMNLAGEVLWHQTVPCVEPTPDSALALAADLVTRAQAAAPGRTPLGIGLAMPAPSMPGWKDLSACDLLESRLRLPLQLEQHASCLALAERWFGAADLDGKTDGPGDNFICIHLGDTIDLGLVIAGNIYRGSTGNAGDFGHVPLDPNGPPCACGDRGCLQTYCTTDAIIHHADIPNTTIVQLAELAATDTRARAAFERMGAHLGLGIAHLIHLFDPALIILTGKTTAGAPFFQPAMNEAIHTHIRANAAPACPILISQLNHLAPAMGACGMVLQSAFDTVPTSNGNGDAAPACELVSPN